MALSQEQAERVFQKANAVITQVQSPASRPQSVALKVGDGQYTVRTYTPDKSQNSSQSVKD